MKIESAEHFEIDMTRYWLAPPHLAEPARVVEKAFTRVKAYGPEGLDFLKALVGAFEGLTFVSFDKEEDGWHHMKGAYVLPVSTETLLVYTYKQLALVRVEQGTIRRAAYYNPARRKKTLWSDEEIIIALLDGGHHHPLLGRVSEGLMKRNISYHQVWGTYPEAWEGLLKGVGVDPRAYITRGGERGCTNEMCGHCSHDPAAPIWEVTLPDGVYSFTTAVTAVESTESLRYLTKVFYRLGNQWWVQKVEESRYRFFHGHVWAHPARRISARRLDSDLGIGRFLFDLLVLAES